MTALIVNASTRQPITVGPTLGFVARAVLRSGNRLTDGQLWTRVAESTFVPSVWTMDEDIDI